MTFDWNHARAFLATAELGSLSAAARQLGTSQPTLSRQVAALESELGVTLFERLGKGLTLTDSGRTLLSHVQAMHEAAGRFSLAAAGQSQSLQGPVVISVSEIDACFRLPSFIQQLQQQEPGIELEVVVSNDLSDLKRREADIALRSVRPTEADLIARKLMDESIWLYGHKDYVSSLKSNPGSRPKLIAFNHDERFLALLNNTGWQVSEQDIVLRTRFQLLQWQLALQSCGLIMVPEDIGDSEPRLRRAFAERGAVMTLPLWLVSHRELRTSPRVRRVFDLLAAHIAPQ